VAIVNLFDEFSSVSQTLGQASIRYAVIGGVALALYDRPRFTRDIDILVHPDDASKVGVVMRDAGYFESSSPWTFRDSQLTLRRFMKTEGEDHLIVDILVGADDRHRQIVDSATVQPWGGHEVRVASREDLVWLKSRRGSDQDNVDIRRLQDDEV
jgi:hypothetical protein